MLLHLGLLALAAQSNPVRFEFNVRIPMRDGVALSADIYRPDLPGKFPVILLRTPYDNGTAPNRIAGKKWASQGYVYVIQDVRGRGDSDGEFYPMAGEAADGYDTIQWLAAQPWSNGKVGMTGGSYLGWVQVYAATLKPPALAALVPIVTPTDPDRSFPMQYGSYLPTTVSWLLYINGKTLQDISQMDLFSAYAHRPLREADQLLGITSKAWRDWFDHPAQDAYWEPQRYQKKILDSPVPMLHISGWYDDVLLGTVENFTNLTSEAAKPATRVNQRLILGPWGHATNRGTRLGDIDFGPSAVIDLDGIQKRWFDRWLLGVDNGVERDPKVKIFVMGANTWRDEKEWPLARTRWVKYYLHSGGRANSLLGDGRLDTLPPGNEQPDKFRSDPTDPVPFITDASFSQVGGPDDYRSVERRDDVLVYTSAPLQEATEVCGPLSASIHAATSAKDADWMTKIIAVHPNGFAQRLNDGQIRARYARDPAREQLIPPNTPERFTIDNWATCIRLEPGFRIRVEVASTAFPKWDVNLQTGGRAGFEKDGVPADQTVYHDKPRPSYVLLPVVR
ncbi:MAG: CocE/NonD family hydrolase [Gemmatimonadota bacterium]